MNDTVIKLEVDIQTFNTMIAALDEMPHKLSRRVIDELARQAQPQVQQNEGQMSAQGPMSGKVVN